MFAAHPALTLLVATCTLCFVSHLRAYPPAGEEEFEKQRQALLALKMMKVCIGCRGC